MIRALALSVAALALAACSSTQSALYPFKSSTTPKAAAAPTPAAAGTAAMASAEPTDQANSVPPPLGVPPESEQGLLGSNPYDDLSLGKKQYRAQNYGLAERYFQHAVEMHPRDAEAWLGLAATYDELRRFDLADRAYAQAIRIVGVNPVILNNQGYSYMLRGDYARARATLLKAERLDPHNKYVANNLRLLNKSERTGKAIE